MKNLRPHGIPPLESDTMPGPRKKRGKKRFGVKSTRTWMWRGRRWTWTRWYQTKSAQQNAFAAALKEPHIFAVEKVER